MFGQRLFNARKAKNLTLEQLAQIYNDKFDGGLSKGTLSKYENGKQEPMISTVGNLASILGVSVDYLINDEDVTDTENKNWFFYLDNIAPIKSKKFPMLGEIACGKPIFCNEDHETFIDANSDINADFCLVAKGDSMTNARIFDGDIVFIKEQPIVENGEIAAVIIDNEATLKRVYYYPDKNKLILQAENPNYEPFVYINEELNQIQILGKAVAFMSFVK